MNFNDSVQLVSQKLVVGSEAPNLIENAQETFNQILDYCVYIFDQQIWSRFQETQNKFIFKLNCQVGVLGKTMEKGKVDPKAVTHERQGVEK